MLNYFRSTDFKFKIASTIYKALMLLNINTKRTIKRNGVFYDVDLSEGVDLALFLFGSFQKNVTQSKAFKIPVDGIIMDVGANIGSISLPMAFACRKGMVYAFEPTDFAFEKLETNIELNPELKDRIVPMKCLVSSSSGNIGNGKVFSSWKLSHSNALGHPVHHGIAMNAVGIQTSLDDFVKKHALTRLDFIKIDTDGHELDVISGALNSIKHFRPVIVFELTLYLLKERSLSFSDFEALLTPLHYYFVDTKSCKTINQATYHEHVPKGGSIDVVAIPGTVNT